VDITAQVGASWAEAFTDLEINNGLDINNMHHIWLLHHIFLQSINQQLSFFVESWNQHRMQIHDGPNRSPADMFGFDMLVHGLHGSHLPGQNEENMTDEELEVYGVDWEALQNDRILESVRQNGRSDTNTTSWIGRVGPPDNWNEVSLSPPDAPSIDSPVIFDSTLTAWITAQGQNTSISSIWIYGLALACTTYIWEYFLDINSVSQYQPKIKFLQQHHLLEPPEPGHKVFLHPPMHHLCGVKNK
jgi:hypothetical protein